MAVLDEDFGTDLTLVADNGGVRSCPVSVPESTPRDLRSLYERERARAEEERVRADAAEARAEELRWRQPRRSTSSDSPTCGGGRCKAKDVVRQITAKGRFARALKSVHDWCKRNRHLPVKAQQDYLARVIRGHCAYYGLTGNRKRLSWFRYQVTRVWRKWLTRRSRLRRLNWDRMNELLKRNPLPPVTITRSWQRFLSEPVR